MLISRFKTQKMQLFSHTLECSSLVLAPVSVVPPSQSALISQSTHALASPTIADPCLRSPLCFQLPLRFTSTIPLGINRLKNRKNVRCTRTLPT